AHEQQVHGFGEPEPAHHLIEGVAANLDLVRFDGRERGLPALVGRPRLRASLYALEGHMLSAPVSYPRSAASIQTVPYSRSPKSPRPGTMYFCAFNSASITGV